MNLPSSRRARRLPPAPPPRASSGAAVPQPLKVEQEANCPRCHALLTDPHGIGLCPRCGYCRSLHLEGVAVLAAAGKLRLCPPVLPGLRHSLRVAPAALLAVSVAFVAVVPLAYLADQRYPLGSRARAVWSAGSLLCGVLLLLAGQAWAIALLKRMNERINWGDLLSPLQVWGLAVRRLPTTAWPIGLGGSGFLAVLAAVVWVGGLTYWISLSPRIDEDGSTRRVAAAGEKESRVSQDLNRVTRVLGLRQSSSEAPAERTPESPVAAGTAVAQFASANPVPAGISVADTRPIERCVIVGFVPASEGQEPGLVLATLREGQLTFAGVVRNGLKQKAEVLDRLSKLGRARPIVEGLNLNAVWVRPEVFCDVHQSGSDAKGELVDPNLRGLIED
jgi:hypothetical protein